MSVDDALGALLRDALRAVVREELRPIVHDQVQQVIETVLGTAGRAPALDPDGQLTVAEAAAVLKITEPTVRDWIKSGQLPATKLGRTYRVFRRDLDALRTGGIDSTGITASPSEEAARIVAGVRAKGR